MDVLLFAFCAYSVRFVYLSGTLTVVVVADNELKNETIIARHPQ